MSSHRTDTALIYPLGEHPPNTGQATQVAEGMYWLRMGLPFALDHINLWLLRDRLPDPQQPGREREGAGPTPPGSSPGIGAAQSPPC